MTPREGVSKVRVVCDLCDGTGTITIVDHYDDEGKSVYAPEECPECEGRLYVERTPYVDPAHPAATAREEAWKALLAYAECEDAYKKASQSNDWMAPLTAAGWDGKSNPRPFINRLRARALALARSAQ